jgi:hypothetical protein
MVDAILSESPFTDADPDVVGCTADTAANGSFFKRKHLSLTLNTKIAQYSDNTVAPEWNVPPRLHACIS